MEQVERSIPEQLHQDFSPFFNKDKICNFQFELKHRFEWFSKVKKIKWKCIRIFSGICLLIGIIVCLLQLWYNKAYPVDKGIYPFVWGGVIIWILGWLIDSCILIFVWCWFSKIGHDYYDIFAQGRSDGYLCDDLSKYPVCIRITYYLNEAVTRPTKGGRRSCISICTWSIRSIIIFNPN